MALKPIKKEQTLSDKAYYIIRDAVVFGNLSAGDVLTEEKLSAELGISRTPLRTAFNRLVAEGLAEVQGKSVTVTRIKKEDSLKIAPVRARIETLVIEELQGKITNRLITQLRGNIAGQKKCRMDSAGSYMEYIQKDYQFHTILARETGNNFLLDLVERINIHSNRCLMLSSTLATSFATAIGEHTEIVDALEAEDIPRAMAAMETHIKAVGDRLV